VNPHRIVLAATMARIPLATFLALAVAPAAARDGWGEYDGTKELAGRPDRAWADGASPAAPPAAPDSIRGRMERWL